MALSPGTQLGQFEITGSLGAGGMGEVYRARDTKLGRDVAIKVLPEVFTVDAERLGRFQREAQLLASLNHPNIATIHDYAHDAELGIAGGVGHSASLPVGNLAGAYLTHGHVGREGQADGMSHLLPI